jgi:tetratricopeptide (TPR) repeat protein
MKQIKYVFLGIFILQSFNIRSIDISSLANYEAKLLEEDPNSFAYLDLLEKTLAKHPDVADLWLERGRFYNDNNLPQSAIDSALKALELQVLDYTEAWQLLISSYSMLGLYNDALTYVRLYSETFPFDERARSELLWYMFKTMQIIDGIALGEEARLDFPTSIEIHSLLAILYGSSYNYGQADWFYAKALTLAEEQNNIDSQLITLYNRYLLEIMFRRFVVAENYLNQALALNNNDPPLLHLLASLEYGKMNYSSAIKAYKDASRLVTNTTERTPLIHKGLIELHITFGHLDEAARLLSEIERNPGTQWMSRWGINSTLFSQSIAELHLRLWQARLNDARTQVIISWNGLLQNLGMRILSAFEVIYHTQRVRFLSLMAGNEQFSHNNLVDAYYFYKRAVSGNPWLYKELLNRSEALEQQVNPGSFVYHNFERALRRKSTEQLLISYNQLDHKYERERLARVLERLISIAPSKTINPAWYYELYALNPYALRAKGMRFKLVIDNQEPSKRQVNALRRARILPDKDSPYQLVLDLKSTHPSASLFYHSSLKWQMSLDPWTKEAGLPLLTQQLQRIVFTTAL